MHFKKTDFPLMTMIGFTLVMPLLIGLYMQNFAGWRFISLPIHAAMETIGAIIAFVLSAIIFMMYSRTKELNHFHRAAFALIAMGVFDLFHAMTAPGEQFVWLHSLAIFFGGILFSFVWISDTKVSPKTYLLSPILILLVFSGIAFTSFLFPEWIPQMLNEEKEFTQAANLLNIIGGVMYVIASFYFIQKYIEDEETDNLLFAAHTMLFGSAGVLFFFSALWDMSWWFWHTLRLLAYIVSLYFMLKIFYDNLRKLENSNLVIQRSNEHLLSSNKMLKEYQNAIYQGSIISIADLDGNITYVNDELLKITGYQEAELLGKPHKILRDPETPKSVFKKMWQEIQNKQTFKGLIKNRKKDGTSFYAKITIIPILDKNNDIFEYVALREDVTELVNSQNELKIHFYTDRLTGLGSRFKLIEDLKTFDFPHIALINIDNFKSVNDFYGMEFGDKVIQSLANRMLESLDPYHYHLYRNHGDEMAILAEHNMDYSSFQRHLEKLLNDIENAQFIVNDVYLDIHLSAGLAESTSDIIKADLALKEAKQTKRTLVKYSTELNVEKLVQSNIEWSQKIKDALREDRIKIMLQPLFHNPSQKIYKYEALVRLIETDGEIISPYAFLEVAKRTRLYSQITRRVIQKAFTALGQLDSKSQISINICAEDIFDETSKNYLLNLLKESDNADRIILELVESEGIESFSQVKSFIEEVKRSGAKIAIDDFGTGYSNFEYLLKLHADYIKIDGSLIRNIDIDENRYSVVETIVAFAKKNSMPVVAEFVSSEQIQQKVLELGIDYSQGYFIDRPRFVKELGRGE